MTIRTVTLLGWVLGLSLVRPAEAQESVLADLRAAAKAAPSDLEAQRALGLALIEAGRLAEAETQMNAVVRLAKGSIEALFDARRVQFASDDYKKARAGCRELVAKDARHVLSHVCMARAFLVWRRASRASEHIDAALAADPNHYEAQLVLADSRLVQGDFAGALTAYQAALGLKPSSADAQLGLGLVHALAGRSAEALAALRKAHELSRNDPDVLLELGRRLSGAEAVAMLQQAVNGRPKWPEAELALATAQLKAGDAANAEAKLKALLKQSPDSPIAVAQHGAALVALGRYEEAEPKLKRALELIPNDFDTAFALAMLYEHTKRHEEAFTQYRNAADLKRENPEPLIAAARLGLALERPLLAGALLDKALERTPRSAQVLALYGEVHARRGDPKAARDFLQRALQGEGPLDRAAVQKRLADLK